MKRLVHTALVRSLALVMLAGAGPLFAAEVPFSVMVTLAQADGYLEIGDYEQAILHYRSVTQQASGAGRAWYGLGRALTLNGQADLAIEPLQRSVELCRDKSLAWNELGNAHYNQEDFGRAERCYGESLALSEDAVVYYNRGNARRRSDRNQEAIRDFDAAIAIDDSDPDFFNDRGIAYWNLSDWHQAATDFSKACGMSPENETMVQNYRNAIIELSAWPAMVTSAKVLLKKAPDNSETNFMLALGQWNQGQVADAYGAVSRAIELNQEQPEYYDLRAEIFGRQGRSREARRDAQEPPSCGSNRAGQAEAQPVSEHLGRPESSTSDTCLRRMDLGEVVQACSS